MRMILFMALFCLVSCQPNQEIKGKEYTGFDIQGLERTCTNRDDEMCTMVYTDGERFADECRDAGFEAIQCGCHDYMCSQPVERTGRDINGELSSCFPATEDLICTTEFTPQDQFAQDCRDANKEVITCGCHDFLCSDI